jgi:hypothetical protein
LQQLAYLGESSRSQSVSEGQQHNRTKVEDKEAVVTLIYILIATCANNQLNCFETINKHLEQSGKPIPESVKRDEAEHLITKLV